LVVDGDGTAGYMEGSEVRGEDIKGDTCKCGHADFFHSGSCEECSCDDYEFDPEWGCTHCGGEGTCDEGSDPLGNCPDDLHRCHACGGSGRRSDQRIF
jgi:hypothetical protein